MRDTAQGMEEKVTLATEKNNDNVCVLYPGETGVILTFAFS